MASFDVDGLRGCGLETFARIERLAASGVYGARPPIRPDARGSAVGARALGELLRTHAAAEEECEVPLQRATELIRRRGTSDYGGFLRDPRQPREHADLTRDRQAVDEIAATLGETYVLREADGRFGNEHRPRIERHVYWTDGTSRRLGKSASRSFRWERGRLTRQSESG